MQGSLTGLSRHGGASVSGCLYKKIENNHTLLGPESH